MAAVTMIAVRSVRASGMRFQRAGASPPPDVPAVLRYQLKENRRDFLRVGSSASGTACLPLIATSFGTRQKIRYFRFRFLPAAVLAVLAVFFGDFFALFLSVFFVDDEPLPPEKIFSQLSEYCFVAPMRTTLMTGLCS